MVERRSTEPKAAGSNSAVFEFFKFEFEPVWSNDQITGSTKRPRTRACKNASRAAPPDFAPYDRVAAALQTYCQGMLYYGNSSSRLHSSLHRSLHCRTSFIIKSWRETGDIIDRLAGRADSILEEIDEKIGESLDKRRPQSHRHACYEKYIADEIHLIIHDCLEEYIGAMSRELRRITRIFSEVAEMYSIWS